MNQEGKRDMFLNFPFWLLSWLNLTWLYGIILSWLSKAKWLQNYFAWTFAHRSVYMRNAGQVVTLIGAPVLLDEAQSYLYLPEKSVPFSSKFLVIPEYLGSSRWGFSPSGCLETVFCISFTYVESQWVDSYMDDIYCGLGSSRSMPTCGSQTQGVRFLSFGEGLKSRTSWLV